jgi:hypothetical protein
VEELESQVKALKDSAKQAASDSEAALHKIQLKEKEARKLLLDKEDELADAKSSLEQVGQF